MTIDIERLIGALRRQFKIIMIFSILGAMFGVAYVMTTQPLFTAAAELLIEDQQTNVGGANGQSALEIRFDDAKIESQVVLLKSERLGLSVIEKLNLTENPVFMSSGDAPGAISLSSIKALFDLNAWLGIEEELTEEEKTALQRQAFAKLKEDLTVKRVGTTYVLQIGFTSVSPKLAAQIANAYGDAYLLDQLNAKYDATRRASDWLQSRIQGLREQSLATDLAVQRFRTENNLIAADGLLLGEQQLADMNSQLVLARAETAQARARHQRIEKIIASGLMNAAVTEALNNPVIADLRSKFLDASKRYSEISQSLGENHVQAQKFQSDMTEYQIVIFDELRRIAESYQSEYEIAKSREQSLQESLTAMAGESALTNETMVTLRELERESETYKNLYQTFLQRYQETVQQQSFPVTEARIITFASAPEDPSHPRKALVLALSLVLGGMAGTGLGAFREYRDRGVRTGQQVRESLGLEFLGLLPILPSKAYKPKDAAGSDKGEWERVIQPKSTIMRQTIDAPLSAFSETLRAGKIAADLMLGDKSTKIIGMMSIFPGEGKSTTSKNFASLLAKLGARTLLIDCDLRNPGLTRAVASDAKSGLLEVLLDEKDLKSSLMVEPDSKLFVLPVVSKQRIPHTSELLSSPAMKRLLLETSKSFDFVVVDLPPVATVVDVRAMAHLIDAFVMVVEWGKTPRQTIRSTLSHDPRLREKCLGVVVNKVDRNTQKMYESSGSEGYQYASYSKYYTD